MNEPKTAKEAAASYRIEEFGEDSIIQMWDKDFDNVFIDIWQQAQSDPAHIGEIVRQTLEYVANIERFTVFNDVHTIAEILSLQPEIINQIIKKKWKL